MKRYILAILCLALAFAQLEGKKNDGITVVRPSERGARSTFAIFVDSKTWDNCSGALMNYREVLQEEGLGTFIYAADWQSPEVIRDIIKNDYKRHKLEGVVFVGNIPIVRVSGAQHMTTAFKMNETKFDRTESWVTTDRFYDDLDLDWRYCDRDSADTGVFYYHLTDKGAQYVASDIYSARMQVPECFEGDKYQILRDYLAEVVRAHGERNFLDNVIYYGGSGYNGDCLSLWRQKPIAWREYFPLAFESAEGNKFYNYRYSATVKYQLYNELQRPEVDLFQFSEHGAEDTQYISQADAPNDIREYIDAMRAVLRYAYNRRYKGKEGEEEFLKEAKEVYLTDPEFFTAEQPGKESADEPDEVNMMYPEIVKLHSQPRVLIFNACYNGSFWFREGYVAGCHIFNGGRSIVAQGNTVNALQDKYEDELIGMLSLGYRVGKWQQKLPYLESHLIGDPTFRFNHKETPADAATRQAIDLREMADKALARGKSCSAQLLEAYKTSSSWEVRLEALHCLSFFADENFVQALMLAMGDPYEHIMRMACIYAGDNGDPRLEEGLRHVMETQDQNVRAQYVAKDALTCFECSRQRNDKMLSDIFDKEASERDREDSIRYLRNNPLHYDVQRYVDFVLDESQPLRLRVVMAEALGWFNRSWQRDKIAKGFAVAKSNKYNCPSELREEMNKTLKRLR